MSNPKVSNSSTEASTSYPWILDHILSYPATNEIPLRTMYTLNSSPRAQPLPHQYSSPTSPTPAGSIHSPLSSPTSPRFPVDQYDLYNQNTNDHFRTNLMAQLSQVPAQPCSLPPSFITSFVRRCFTEDLAQVDFPHALTGLDYLRDLESRRKREIAATLGRMGIQKGDISGVNKSTELSEWMRHISRREEMCERFYTQCYIGLRRWTLVNEMSLLPFNKPNCYAMLNTLYPPSSHPQTLTPQITPQILQSQRDGFWRYIQGVEKNGPDILKNLTEQGRRPELGETNGWAATRQVVDQYLRVANAVIDECTAIPGPQYFGPPPTSSPEDKPETRGGRKVDSGISFSSDDRPSTSGDSRATVSTTATSVHTTQTSTPTQPKLSASKSLPASPTFGRPADALVAVVTLPPPPPAKPLSALEKLVRKMRKKDNGEIFLSTDATANTNPATGKKYPPSAFNSKRGLRKQASLDSNRLRIANASAVSIETSRGLFRSKTSTPAWD
ncbi:MAG: hypothetical protein M1814_005537 [Vezdaea aestivalis]|nr:MAG: hypothetical protein M1814_005537 [Vezdaea aestivalis]